MKEANFDGDKTFLEPSYYDPQDLLIPMMTREMTVPVIDRVEALFGDFDHSLIEGIPEGSAMTLWWNY